MTVNRCFGFLVGVSRRRRRLLSGAGHFWFDLVTSLPISFVDLAISRVSRPAPPPTLYYLNHTIIYIVTSLPISFVDLAITRVCRTAYNIHIYIL